MEIEISYYHEPSEQLFIYPFQYNYINLLNNEKQAIGRLFILDAFADERQKQFIDNLISGKIKHLSEYDALFPSIDDIVVNKAKAAICRLEYPLELEDKYERIYRSYLMENAYIFIPTTIKAGDVSSISVLACVDSINLAYIDEYIEIANKFSQLEIITILLDYKNRSDRPEPSFTFDLGISNPSHDWIALENASGTLTINQYRGNGINVKIPSIIKDKKVSRIHYSIGSLSLSIFYTHKDKVHSVIIEDGIEEIGERAFLECRNLQSVIIPGSINWIGKDAFSGCKSLTTVSIPGDVVIGEAAFEFCTALNQVIMLGRVADISHLCFYGCENLARVIFKGEVKSISKYAFGSCDNLVIHSPKGSYAIEYAKKNNLKYVEM